VLKVQGNSKVHLSGFYEATDSSDEDEDNEENEESGIENEDEDT